jgi:hypothetical protein
LRLNLCAGCVNGASPSPHLLLWVNLSLRQKHHLNTFYPHCQALVAAFCVSLLFAPFQGLTLADDSQNSRPSPCADLPGRQNSLTLQGRRLLLLFKLILWRALRCEAVCSGSTPKQLSLGHKHLLYRTAHSLSNGMCVGCRWLPYPASASSKSCFHSRYWLLHAPVHGSRLAVEPQIFGHKKPPASLAVSMTSRLLLLNMQCF